MLSEERQRKYHKLDTYVINSPMYEIVKIKLPNSNRLFAKEEWLNFTGTHYDRIYARLLREFEESGKISPGKTHLVETTSGNAGSAFAHLCDYLGYSCTVILPADTPKARIVELRHYGAHLKFSPAAKYVSGVVDELQKYLLHARKDRRDVFCLNHSRQKSSVDIMRDMAAEMIGELPIGIVPDFFVSAIGN
jgi:cysteine synthase